MNNTPEKSPAAARQGRRVAAIVLLLVAGFALFGKYLPFAWRDGVLLLGCGFIAWGALGQVAALLIPGGILVGISTGALLRPEYGTGVFLLAMAGGFALISGLTYLFFQKWVRWPVYPASGLSFCRCAPAGRFRVAPVHTGVSDPGYSIICPDLAGAAWKPGADFLCAVD